MRDVFIGLPTGVAMFVGVSAVEAMGWINLPGQHTDPKKYEFVSKVYGKPPSDDAHHGHGHGGDGHHSQ